MRPPWWCHLEIPQVGSAQPVHSYLTNLTQLTTRGHHCSWLHIRCDISFHLLMNFLCLFLSRSHADGGSYQPRSVNLCYCKLQSCHWNLWPLGPVIAIDCSTAGSILIGFVQRHCNAHLQDNSQSLCCPDTDSCIQGRRKSCQIL